MNISELDIKTQNIPPPVDPEFIDKWFEQSKQAARLHTQNNNYHEPTVLYLADDPMNPGGLIEGRIDVSSFFINQEGKRKFALLAPSLFAQLKAFAVLSIFESYCLMGSERLDEYKSGGYRSMGDVPGSHEILMITLQTRAKISVQMLDIVRDESGDIAEVRRDPINTFEGEEEATGAMVGWVPESGGDVN